MGCNASRLDANGVPLPTKFRPLFLQRLGGITLYKQARPLKDPTVSKKELLLSDGEEDGTASRQQSFKNGRKSVSTTNDCRSCANIDDLKGIEPDTTNDQSACNDGSRKSVSSAKPRASCVTPVDLKGLNFEALNEEALDKDCRKSVSSAKPRGSCVTPEDMKGLNFEALNEEALDKNCRSKMTDKDVKKQENDAKKGESKTNEEVKNEKGLKDVEVDEEEEDLDDERMIGYGGGDAYPGSPSFKVYYVDTGEDRNEGDADSFKDAASTDDAVSSKESVKKKGESKKRRSFRRVLPKGGQQAVKNLLNVTSCYNPSNSAHDRENLLTPKSSSRT